jgi:hypothetical protein
MDRQYNGKKNKRMDRQYNGKQNNRGWTDNTMVTQIIEKKQTIQWTNKK